MDRRQFNNTIRFNNVSDTVVSPQRFRSSQSGDLDPSALRQGASSTDGVHVCQHGDNHGSGPRGMGCRNLSYGIYL